MRYSRRPIGHWWAYRRCGVKIGNLMNFIDVLDVLGHRPGHLDGPGGGCVSRLVLRGAPGCQAGLLLPR